jgi:hypothetical protein
MPQHASKCLTELGVAIHEQIAHTQKESIERVRKVPSNLLHPALRRIHSATGEMNATGGHLHYEKHIESDQSTLGPHFNRCEVDCAQNVPVGLQERLPSRLPLPIRRWLNAVLFQDVADRLI